MVEIIPAIIAKSSEELETMVRKVESHVSRVHLDIMDGIFVPNTTINGYEEVAKIKTSLKFDVHLMVANPLDQLYKWYPSASADRFIIHAEIQNGLRESLENIKSAGYKTGLAFNPETRFDEMRALLELTDLVQFMAVNPGFYGGEFIESVVGKISEFHQSHFETPIAVDGGINPDTARKVLSVGASILVSGSYIMNHSNPGEAINKLKSL